MVGDFGRSKLFWNNKDGTFTECTRDCGINEHDVRCIFFDLLKCFEEVNLAIGINTFFIFH